jgi:hypothetical protein
MGTMMKPQKKIYTALIIALFALSPLAQAENGNWKKGRIYFRMVCNDCHVNQAGGKILPKEKTKAEWQAYFDKNIHGPQDGPHKYTVDYFVSEEYRESIKGTNRAANKMLKVPSEQLLEDVKAFLKHTAKDSDQPSGCE